MASSQNDILEEDVADEPLGGGSDCTRGNNEVKQKVSGREKGRGEGEVRAEGKRDGGKVAD